MFPSIWEYMGYYGFFTKEAIHSIYDLNCVLLTLQSESKREHFLYLKILEICQIDYKPGSVI